MIFTCKECDQVSDYSQVTSEMREAGMCMYCYEEISDEIMESYTSLEEAIDNIGQITNEFFSKLPTTKQ